MQPSQASTQKIARHALVSGRVQGVGYRYALAEQAQQYELQGWCRNLPDGRVEAWLQGEPESVNAVLTWMHDGPLQAVVEHVMVREDTVEDSAEADGQAFEIRR